VKIRENPLTPKQNITLDVATLRSPTVFRKLRPSSQKVIRRLTRAETAREAVADLVIGQDVFGFTKGQFSLLDLIAAINDQVGPCHLTLSTWTAANADLDHVFAFLSGHKLLSARFVLDFTFQRRQPAVAQKIRDTFGRENIRVTRNHSKFALMESKRTRLVLKTSMNLNTNPRFENFEVSWDPDLFDFLKTICEELFEDARDQAVMENAALQRQFNETT
jgi:hypothetical protein